MNQKEHFYRNFDELFIQNTCIYLSFGIYSHAQDKNLTKSSHWWEVWSTVFGVTGLFIYVENT